MCDSSQQQTPASNDGGLSMWVERWQANKIGFHRNVLSELFKRHLLPKLLSAKTQQCVVFTLCGKTVDMKAVLDAGHQVIGIEGCETAVEAFFTENNIAFEIEKDEINQWQAYKGTGVPITLYVADFFKFSKSLPPVDFIWDRGGLVAISPSSREQYRDSLYRMMTPNRTQLFLVAINYTDPTYSGPPFVVSDNDVNSLFGSQCSTELLEEHDETEEQNARNPARVIDFMEERLHSIIKKQG